MKQVDKLVAHLVRFAADALVAASDAPVMIRSSAGDRTSNQVLDHASVKAMVLEVLPTACEPDLRGGATIRFVYEGSPSGVVTLEVVPGASAWRVTLLPGATPGLPRTAPDPPAEPVGVERLLRMMSKRGASDLHLSVGCPPLVRLHGEILALESAPPFTDAQLRSILMAIAPARNREEFQRRHDTDFAYEIPGVSRFRVNLFTDRNGVGAVMRRIPYEILSAEKLGLPQAMMDFCELSKGLVLVTGPTGSGKSTTLAAIIDRINATRDEHILTIEDPIEFVHPDKRCLISQREVRVHTEGFRQALRAALREDPDVVLVGEMRDLETIEIAIETAETGHLVFGTLHTNTAPSTVDRIIDQFPSDRQPQIRTMLSESLKGVVSQTLCKKVGGGRAAAYEILTGTTAVANLIREGKTYQLYGQMQSCRNLGMVTMNDSLFDLVMDGVVEPREAYLKAIHKADFRTLLGNAGVTIPEA
ncbi:MAG: type IV pilus twitching motility protein PilT [Polyangiales bacterium]